MTTETAVRTRSFTQALNEALAILHKCVELEGEETAFATYFLAMIHARKGDKKVARKWFDGAVRWHAEKQPDDTYLAAIRAEAEKLLGIAKK